MEPFLSLETLDRHSQTHNDIKPENFLVKFKNGANDLTQLAIALTDFGIADPDSKLQLSADIMDIIDGIIINNMTATFDKYINELSPFR